jgi:hypothetical protein
MTNSRHFLLSIALTSLALVSPLSVSAATTQQSLDAAFGKLTKQPPIAINGTVDVKTTERSYTKTYKAVNSAMKASFSAAFQQKVADHSDSSGRISLDSYTSSDASSSNAPAGSFEWRSIQGTTYLYVTAAAEGLAPLQKMGLDLSPLLNTWIRIDAPTSTSSDSPTPMSALSDLPGVSTLQVAKSAGTDANGNTDFTGRFRISRVEKTTTAANGDKILRLRLAPNYTNIAKEQAAKRATILKTQKAGKARTAALTDLNTEYNAIRKAVSGVNMVAVLDETAQSIQRIELSGTQKKPKQDCQFSDYSFKFVCKNIAQETTTFTSGINVSNGTSEALIAPATSKTLEDIMNAMNPPEATSTTESGM